VSFVANTPCYCPGTLIATPRGEVAIEDLAIGDEVVTASGQERSIRWIGRRSYSGRFALGQKHILPICIKAGALKDNIPRRDLWISPHHAMYLKGTLIEARDLVNEVSIFQAQHVEKIEYFHIELDSHDVILAEGALAETFVDDDSRCMFHNVQQYRVLYPDEQQNAARYCAPRLDVGYEVEAARRQIDSRAGLRSAEDHPLELRGFVDVASSRRIAGWAQNATFPEAPVCLDIYAADRLIGQTLANRYREDLERAGLGSGRHSFEFTPPVGLAFTPDAIKVCRSLDGETLACATPARRASVRLDSRYRHKGC
jgi:O-antigen biosynthesis protein